MEHWQPSQVVHFGPASRRIAFFGDVSSESVTAFISQLLELAHADVEAPIEVFLNTVGGSLPDALAAYDVMRSLPCPVLVIAMGNCASAGLLLLAGGDARLCFPNTRFFYHQVILGVEGFTSPKDMQAVTQCYLEDQESGDRILKQRFRIPAKAWREHFQGSRATFLSADQAKQYGMVQEVLEPPRKPKVTLTLGDDHGVQG